MRNGGWLGTIRPPQSSGGIITLNKLWPGQGGAAPVFPTPVEWWKTNEGSGASLLTQSGSGNALTFNGTWTNPGSTFPFVVPTYSTSSATGANATNTSFSGSTPFSVSVWVNSSNISAFQVILGNITGAGTTGWELALGSSGSVNVTISSTYPTSAIAVHSSQLPVTANLLHHVVFTYDGSQAAGNVKMYVDGTLLTSVIDNNTLTTAIVSANAVVAGNRGGSFSFVGAIADMRIYAAQLSAAQVSTLFSGGVV